MEKKKQTKRPLLKTAKKKKGKWEGEEKRGRVCAGESGREGERVLAMER